MSQLSRFHKFIYWLNTLCAGIWIGKIVYAKMSLLNYIIFGISIGVCLIFIYILLIEVD